MYFETLVIKWNSLSEGVQQKLEQITGCLALISTGTHLKPSLSKARWSPRLVFRRGTAFQLIQLETTWCKSGSLESMVDSRNSVPFWNDFPWFPMISLFPTQTDAFVDDQLWKFQKPSSAKLLENCWAQLLQRLLGSVSQCSMCLEINRNASASYLEVEGSRSIHLDSMR